MRHEQRSAQNTSDSDPAMYGNRLAEKNPGAERHQHLDDADQRVRDAQRKPAKNVEPADEAEEIRDDAAPRPARRQPAVHRSLLEQQFGGRDEKCADRNRRIRPAQPQTSKKFGKRSTI